MTRSTSRLVRLFVLALFPAISFQASAQTVDLSAGFNLLGNSSSEALDVATAFGDPAKVTTVWKWVASTSKWAFYAPSLSAAALQAFAASRDYDVLGTVNGGEGFWVDAKTAFSAQLPAGTAVTAASLKSRLVTPGWHLLSIGDNLTPEQLGQAFGTPPISLWAWNAAQTISNWYFYAASLVAQGANALSDFIASSGFLDFGANRLSPGTGFWVNMPAAPAPLSMVGAWSGTGVDSNANTGANGTTIVTWTLAQTDARVSGTVNTRSVDPVGTTCNSCHRNKTGTLSGTVTGTAMTFTISFPPGVAGDPTPLCTATITGTVSGITQSSFTASYSGDDSCEGPLLDGTLTMARQP
ncbi:MAG: hypothetical protein HYY28_14540 [Betaproteobacteria bacterium]|nr:hypothetical protein [Betaproteobacteria bacterium]MBI2961528.1 hypothetical protein [Betaproteobacteria bacterium]